MKVKFIMSPESDDWESLCLLHLLRVFTQMHPAENLDWSLLQNTALDTCQTHHSPRSISDSSLQYLIQSKHLNSQSCLTEPFLLRWPVKVLQVLGRQKANLDLTARCVVSWHTRDICLINTVNNNSITTVLHCTTWARAVQLEGNSAAHVQVKETWKTLESTSTLSNYNYMVSICSGTPWSKCLVWYSWVCEALCR